MFKEQRTDKVLEIIREKKYVTVDMLVSLLHYSPATIRRDITYLANLGFVRKSYGGVSIINSKPVIVREHDNITEKIEICRKASDLINDGDYVFIDGTTTTYFLGEMLLKKKNVTVVTTNLKLAMFLGEHKVNCYVCSGQVWDSEFLCGVYVSDLIDKMNFDCAFFSVGVLANDGRFSIYEKFSSFMQSAKKHSKRSILLCDSKKIGLEAKRYFGDLNFFDAVISDEQFSNSLVESFPETEFIVT